MGYSLPSGVRSSCAVQSAFRRPPLVPSMSGNVSCQAYYVYHTVSDHLTHTYTREKDTRVLPAPPPPVKQPYYPITMVHCMVLKGSCRRLAGCLGFAILFHIITLGSNAYQTVYHGKRMVFTMVNVLVFTLVSFLSV